MSFSSFPLLIHTHTHTNNSLDLLDSFHIDIQNPQERQNNAKKHCDDILEHVKKDDFKVSDIKKKIKPPPVFIASSTYDGK